MEKELMWTIAKWTLVVFIAGFVGQFGKSLTKHLLARIKGKPIKSKKQAKLDKKKHKKDIKKSKKNK